MRIPVVIVSRVRLIRDALAHQLTVMDGRIEIVAAIDDVSRLLDTGSPIRRCIVVVDATRGTTEGVAGALARSIDRLEVVAVGVETSPGATTGGGGSVWPRSLPAHASVVDLLGFIREVADGWGPDDSADGPGKERALSDLASTEESAGSAVLTAREREVALLLQRGLSNKEIAGRLEIRPATVKNHVHKILAKLRVRRRGEAVAVMRAIWREEDGGGERPS
jgi:two-component system, NarL family, nitrate/nitrite response regulator NarL